MGNRVKMRMRPRANHRQKTIRTQKWPTFWLQRILAKDTQLPKATTQLTC